MLTSAGNYLQNFQTSIGDLYNGVQTSMEDIYNNLKPFSADTNKVTFLESDADHLTEETLLENPLETVKSDLSTESLNVSDQPRSDSILQDSISTLKNLFQDVEDFYDTQVNSDENSNSWKGYAIKGGIITAGAVAAPFVVTAGLSAIGFTTAGITAGSVAASIMSMSGGTVAAGSACAVLQSVGAAGLGAAGTVIASTAGAAVAGITTKLLEGENGASE